MTKLIKGYTYIVKTIFDHERRFWLVKQTGQRSWVAMEITTCSTGYKHTNVIGGNSISVLNDLQAQSDVKLEIRMYSTTIDMRQEMFEVLKYGRFMNEQ